MTAELTADECVQEMWRACLTQDEDGWVAFDLGSDQWFSLTAECPHGKVRGVSRGQDDPTTAFRAALKKFIAAHPAQPETSTTGHLDVDT